MSPLRIVVLSGLLLWVGATLLLSQVRWFARQPLADRLRPYSPGGMGRRSRSGVLSVDSFREVVGPLSSALGGRLSRVLGVSEEMAIRLERIHSPLDVTGFRVRQLGWSLAGFGFGALLSLAVLPPVPIALLFLL